VAAITGRRTSQSIKAGQGNLSGFFDDQNFPRDAGLPLGEICVSLAA
jgi:hypothetical protein